MLWVQKYVGLRADITLPGHMLEVKARPTAFYELIWEQLLLVLLLLPP